MPILSTRAVIGRLLYISDDSAVAIHASAYGRKVTAAEVAKVRRARDRPKKNRWNAYLRQPLAATIGTDADPALIFAQEAARGSALLLARIAAAHPERVARP